MSALTALLVVIGAACLGQVPPPIPKASEQSPSSQQKPTFRMLYGFTCNPSRDLASVKRLLPAPLPAAGLSCERLCLTSIA